MNIRYVSQTETVELADLGEKKWHSVTNLQEREKILSLTVILSRQFA